MGWVQGPEKSFLNGHLHSQKLELKLTHGNIVQTKQLHSFGGKKESLLMTTLVRSPLWISGYIRNKKDVPMSAITVAYKTLNFWKLESSFGIIVAFF